jgi:hypothetical protein
MPTISLKQDRRSDQFGSAATNRAPGAVERGPSDISALLQLKEGFKKSLSMSGEVGSLAGD